MIDKKSDNYVSLKGIVDSKPVFSHAANTRMFYSFILSVKRISGNFDNIRIIFDKRKISPEKIEKGDNLYIIGQIRTFNNNTGVGSKLKVSVFAQEINFSDQKTDVFENKIYLKGYICKPCFKRLTPLGREITDVLVAVNRDHNKSDYVPCVIWGKNAEIAASLKVGTKVEIEGYIQSREYTKKEDNTIHTVYEVSASFFDYYDNNSL